MQNIKQQFFELFSTVIAQFGADFVDLEVGGSARKVIIKVFVDEIGGIKIQKCALISKALHELMDRPESTFSGDYRLEVSSPGIDRPLRTERDFQRNIERDLEVILAEDGKKYIGQLIGIVDAQIELELEKGVVIKLPISKILRAMIQLKW